MVSQFFIETKITLYFNLHNSNCICINQIQNFNLNSTSFIVPCKNVNSYVLSYCDRFLQRFSFHLVNCDYSHSDSLTFYGLSVLSIMLRRFFPFSSFVLFVCTSPDHGRCTTKLFFKKRLEFGLVFGTKINCFDKELE